MQICAIIRGKHMSDTNSISTAQEAPAQTIADRMAVPFALFSGALFVLLSISYFFLLPRFTNLHLSDGTQLSPRKITQYQLKLTADLQSQEETRVRLVLPVTDESFTSLAEQKRAAWAYADLAEQMRQAVSRLGEPVTTLNIASLSIEGDTVMVTGDIRNVGPRSMTVLAAYVDEIAALPFVTDLEKPSFAREELPGGGFRSPFTMSFTLSRP